MLSTTVVSYNYDKLRHLNEGAKLIADQNGCLIEGTPPKKPLLARFFGVEKDATHTIINQTCRQVFDQIINSHTSPLAKDLPQLAKERIKVKSMLDGISKLGKDILLPQLKSDLYELVESPETLEARLAIRQGIDPKALNQTISGTYVMHNRLGQPWGIFKPSRQEVGGDKNPSWLVWASCTAENWNIDSGKGYLRECAAYQLDKECFSSVPLTVSTNYTHRVLDPSVLPLNKPYFEGSFQLFKKSCSPLIEKLHPYEKCIFRPKNWFENVVMKIYVCAMRVLFYFGLSHIPKDQIHKMAILDIRILNCDRHLANCLIENDTKFLYPIDHGLSLPNKAYSLRFEWKELIQSRLPLSSQSLEYIKNLDPNEDALILKKLGISEDAIERMKIATMLLKEGVARGLNLYQIADLMQKQTHSSNYFENVICYNILTKKASAQNIIMRAINNYLTN